jgi:hypothetical protein
VTIAELPREIYAALDRALEVHRTRRANCNPSRSGGEVPPGLTRRRDLPLRLSAATLDCGSRGDPRAGASVQQSALRAADLARARRAPGRRSDEEGRRAGTRADGYTRSET